jgi:lycopene cyclase domain-containing protein
LNPHYIYFLILALSLLGPLLLSFDKKVAFYKNWKPLFLAMILPGLFYIAWDISFTALEIWKFNPEYITGIFISNLPLEEVLFFLVIPYCCVFIYECLRTYFPKLQHAPDHGALAWNFLAIILLVLAFFYRNKAYTFYTFLFTGTFMLLLTLLRNRMPKVPPKLYFITYGIVLMPFLIVNGFLTAMPVVIYNNGQNMGLRISTIPVEDVFYGFLLFLMNVSIYNILKNKFHAVGQESKQQRTVSTEDEVDLNK